MSRNVFEDLLIKGINNNELPARTIAARTWYRNEAKKMRNINETQLFRSDVQRLVVQPRIGSMYLMHYDPKFKKELPYYDSLPLIFPFQKVPNGFLGINLHYLPLNLRAKLMDSLYDLTNNNKFDETTKLNISYKILNSAANTRYFKPCVKHYLRDHLRSRFLTIYPAEWDVALFLPLERFEKATKTQVWRDTREMLR